MSKYKDPIKQHAAELRARDAHGHFVSGEKQKEHEKKSAFEKLFSENIHYAKNKDDLLDIHVGNPLKKITELLEDIKKQKAFSFTLKGSLGIAGVALALGIFGVMGTGNLLCERGTQRHIGIIQILQVQEEEPAKIPLLSGLLDYFTLRPQHNSTVLIKADETVISIPYNKNINTDVYKNVKVIATGDYNACGQILRINDPLAIEAMK